MDAFALVMVVFLGYLIGSFPSVHLAGRLYFGVDIRTLGDKNPGAANAWHVLGLRFSVVIGVIDTFKGTLAVLLAALLVEG